MLPVTFQLFRLILEEEKYLVRTELSPLPAILIMDHDQD